ncbi:hypothetical protein BCR44DRAFT_1492742 [Catenaria anguillulae PL171]|uniref:HCP-like protein n=1 Tax=Catenaria anguillulae PL171 TaxID=765915 RepID=A0A1Y2I0M4_9FUNG|nr:hypothetical protein BCR44DRAFT_1492742 [Catenaria anguillulae PL171]
MQSHNPNTNHTRQPSASTRAARTTRTTRPIPPTPPHPLVPRPRPQLHLPLIASTAAMPRPPFRHSPPLSEWNRGKPTQRALRIDTSLPLDQLRATTLQSLDPEAHLDFIRYLVSLADQLYAEALKWVKRLATHGPGGLNGLAKTPPFADAMVYLAECHGNALLGLALDHDKAFSLYLQASKLGHPGATYRVAVCYEIGAGTKRDTHRAVQFFKKAASLGDPAALYKLANPREGLVMLKRAAAVADADHPHALHELAMVHEPDPPGGRDPRLREIQHLILPDPAYALELYTQAGKLGYAPAQFRLGTCFEEGDLGCPRDPKTSIMWFTRAAEQGHPDAELALSGWYLEGAEGVLPPDDGQAFAWARRAADKGLSKAEFAVAYYYEMGVGVAQSVDEARRWYQRSAAQGNRKAMERLQEMNTSMKASYKQVKRQKEDCVVM